MASITPEYYATLVEQNGGDPATVDAMLAQGGHTVGEESDLAVAPGAPNMAALSGLLEGQRKSIGDLYDQITTNIQQRYRAPDLNDMLVAIGTGMMSPPGENDSGGFGGSLQRGLRGIGTYAQNRNAYRDDMNKMMSQLDIQKAKELAALGGKYVTGAASMMKPGTGSSSRYDPVRGGYVSVPSAGNNPPMPEMDQVGNYVITDPRQMTYLPPNTRVVYPGGDPTAPKYTPSTR